MASFNHHVRACVLVAIAALSLGASGCSRYGCFDYSEAEYEAFDGCPSQEEAIDFFGSPSCGGEVASVDSGPEYRDGYCCYEVTKTDYDNYYYDGVNCQ